MFDKLTARGRVLLALGAAGSVIGAGMTAAAVSSSATVGDISLNPNATSANLLDIPGYNTYVPITAYPQLSDLNGSWRLDLSGLTANLLPTVRVISNHADDVSGNDVVNSDVLSTLGVSDLVGSLSSATHEVFDLTNFDPSSNQILISGATGAPSAVTATLFQDVNHNGIDSGDHTATPVSLNFVDPSQLSLNLTAPGAIAGGDPIASSLSIAPALAPNVASLLNDDQAVNFEYFDNHNNPFGTAVGSLQSDGSFTGGSADTSARASGIYKTRATVLGRLTQYMPNTLDTLSVAPLTSLPPAPVLPPLPDGSIPTAVANTVVRDFNVGELDGVVTPDGPNTINIGTNWYAKKLSTRISQPCGLCDVELVRSGTNSVTYTATALSNGENPVPVPGAPVEFTISAPAAVLSSLTANGAAIPATGLVTVPAGSDGVAHLTVVDSSAKAWDDYVITAVSNGVSAGALCVLYQDAAPTNLLTTPAAHAYKTGSDAFVSSQALDQWNQALSNTNGYSVMYIDPEGLYNRFGLLFQAGHVIPKSADSVLPTGRNSIFGMVQLGSDGKTVAPFKVHDMPVSATGPSSTWLDNAATDGSDHVIALLLNISDPNLTVDQILQFFCGGSDSTIQWLQDPTPAFLNMDKESAISWADRFAPKRDEMINPPVSIPVDADMGTYFPRFASSLVKLTVQVTNGELPAIGLGGVPVTFTGPAGSSFAAMPSMFLPVPSAFSGSQTVLTDANGFATVWATATKTGKNTFSAAVGNLSDSFTQNYVNLPQDVRNLTVTTSPSSLTSGGASNITATAWDIFHNVVPGVPVMFGSTGVGHLIGGTTWHGATSDYDWTDAAGSAKAALLTAANESGPANVTASVDDLAIGEFGAICTSQTYPGSEFIALQVWENVCGYDGSLPAQGTDPLQDTTSQISDPAGFVYDNPVAGVGAGNGSAMGLLDVAAPAAAAPTVINNITNVTAPAVAAAGGTKPASSTSQAPKVWEKPGKPSVSSPRAHRVRANVASLPGLRNATVDWYYQVKGVWHSAGSTRTNSRGVATRLLTGLASKSRVRVIAFVHGTSAVGSAWSPISNIVKVH